MPTIHTTLSPRLFSWNATGSLAWLAPTLSQDILRVTAPYMMLTKSNSILLYFSQLQQNNPVLRRLLPYSLISQHCPSLFSISHERWQHPPHQLNNDRHILPSATPSPLPPVITPPPFLNLGDPPLAMRLDPHSPPIPAEILLAATLSLGHSPLHVTKYKSVSILKSWGSGWGGQHTPVSIIFWTAFVASALLLSNAWINLIASSPLAITSSSNLTSEGN